jgi:hypothetical protein
MTTPTPITDRLALVLDFARGSYAEHFHGNPAAMMERPLLALNVLREHRVRDDVILGAAVLHYLLSEGIIDRSTMVAAVGEEMTSLAVLVAALDGRTWASQSVRVRGAAQGLRYIALADRIVELEALPDGAWQDQPRLATQARRFMKALGWGIPVSLEFRFRWAVDRMAGKTEGTGNPSQPSNSQLPAIPASRSPEDAMPLIQGPYQEIGRLVRQKRREKGLSRRQLVWWIMESPTLEVTVFGASLMIRELEDQGLVMNPDVLLRILHVVGIPLEEVADLLAQARAASAAAFTEDLKRSAKVLARDQGRDGHEVLAGLVKIVETQNGRPMA